MQQANAQQPGRPGGFPANFQPPPNMPNINFSAPVIRLGTSGPVKASTPEGRDRAPETGGRRAGLGAGNMDSHRQNIRDAMMQLQPPTKDEILRTIFVGGITEGTGGDEGVERILRCAGNLRRWIRATDADDKPCKFGFAEYEDPNSLSVAVDILKDVEVPVKRQMPRDDADKEEDVEVEKSKLLVCVQRSIHFRVANQFYRLSLMTVPSNISTTITLIKASRMTPSCSHGWKLHGNSCLRSSPIWPTLLSPFKPKIFLPSIAKGIFP